MTELILEVLLINFSLCLDAFAAGLAYGAEKIKLPLVSLLVINLICTAFLAVSLFLGSKISVLISADTAVWISAGLLAAIGIWKIAGGLNACKHPEDADKDRSRVISPAEAAALAVALSVDGLAVGFGAGLSTTAALWILLLSLVTDPAAILAGKYVGGKITAKLKINQGLLSGGMLIALAVLKAL